MVIGIIGESCVGKSTLAHALKERIGAEVFTGKDYLRLAKNDAIAKQLFRQKLEAALSGNHIVYVVSEKEHLELLPQDALRVLMTADLDLITERFAARMHGSLPAPVKQMLERKHGLFDQITAQFHIHNNAGIESACQKIVEVLLDE